MANSISKPLHHAILGAGGVGGLIGACLAHAGDSVTLVVRPETLASYPRKLRLESPFGNFTVDVAISAEVPPVDVLWITVKATQLDKALGALKNPNAVRAIVPLLNGIDHVAALRAKYGSERVIPATIAVEPSASVPAHRPSLSFCAVECFVLRPLSARRHSGAARANWFYLPLHRR